MICSGGRNVDVHCWGALRCLLRCYRDGDLLLRCFISDVRVLQFSYRSVSSASRLICPVNGEARS